MNTEHLKIFIAVVECGSFRQAADKVHRSQPAVTKAVQALENQLGITLFQRSQYRATLTPEGEKLYHRAHYLAGEIRSFNKFSALIKDGQEASVSIAIDVLFPLAEIGPLLKNFLTQTPQTDLTIHSEVLGGSLEKLFNGDVDIIIAENTLKDHTIIAQPLLSIPLVSVVTRDYFQANQAMFENPKRIVNALQIVLADSSQHRPKYTFGIIPGTKQWTVTDLYSKKRLIEAGLGWGRLPRCMVAEALANGEMLELAYNYTQGKSVELSLMARAGEILGPITQTLWQQLAEHTYSQHK